jgi:Domain of unknown function (DUF4129)
VSADAPRGEERSVLAAAVLAGLAEAALWYLPVSDIVRETSGATSGPLVSLALFVGGSTLAVLAAAGFRHSKALPVVGGAAGIAVGAVQAFMGAPDVVGVVVIEVLGIAVLLRAVMLATRDWREPVGSFGWGSAVALAEVAVAEPAGWAPWVPVVVPLFFLASLASRGVTTWAAADRRPPPGELGRAAGSRWARAVVFGLACVGGGMAVALALGTPGGVLQGIGRVAVPFSILVVVVAGFALTEKGTPAALADRGGRWIGAIPFIAIGVAVAWVISQHQHRQPFFRIFTGIPLRQHAESYNTAERVAGLLLFALIAYLLLRAFRSRWAESELRGRRAGPEPPRMLRLGPFARLPGARRLRRELPEDAVRRWYAETLEELEGKRLVRPPARTPAEFEDVVAGEFPECADGMSTLTRAYEEVRYGSRRLGRSDLAELDAERRALLRTIAQLEPLEPDDDDQEPPSR